MSPPLPETKLSINAGAQCAPMTVGELENGQVFLQGTDILLAVSPISFPFLQPGDDVVVHIGITRVAVEAVAPKPRLIL